MRRSRALHRGLVTTAATPLEYRDYLRRTRRNDQESFFVIAADSGALAGVINLNDIVRYARQSATLGYYGFTPHAGAGLMRAGLVLVIQHAFRKLRLHRLEANIQVTNDRSRSLVRGLGFRREGVARAYLKIGGRWRDHERWALLADDWRSAPRARPAAASRKPSARR